MQIKRPADSQMPSEPVGGRAPKRTRTEGDSSRTPSSSSLSGPATEQMTVVAPGPAAPMVLVDAQDAGIRLVHALLACAEAAQGGDLAAAGALLKQITALAALQGGAMRKVAAYFGGALSQRIHGLRPPPDSSLLGSTVAELLASFYDTCPYLKFAHFAANQAIVDAVAGRSRVHVIDFGISHGMQWPALLQALVLRPGGPPSVRLTGIGPPQPHGAGALHQAGLKLAQFASAIGVDFHYSSLVAETLADLEPDMLQLEGTADEAVAVNSAFELHRLLALPGAVDKVLAVVRALRPAILTVAEQDVNHNSGSFLDRFTEALHYYSTMFDSLEAAASAVDDNKRTMSEFYLGRQICNIVACEGANRTERHEPLSLWRGRLATAGFEPVPLGSNAFKQVSALLAHYPGGDGYRVEERNGCLTLGWHTRPLIAASAWRRAAAA